MTEQVSGMSQVVTSVVGIAYVALPVAIFALLWRIALTLERIERQLGSLNCLDGGRKSHAD